MAKKFVVTGIFEKGRMNLNISTHGISQSELVGHLELVKFNILNQLKPTDTKKFNFSLKKK